MATALEKLEKSLEKLIKTETVLRNRIERSIENGRTTAVEKRTQGFFEHKMSELKEMWTDYGVMDMEINTLILETKKEHKYKEQNTYGQLEFKYSDYFSELVEGLRKIVPQQSVSMTPPVHSTTVIQSDSLLPKIQLPKYNGSYESWRSFHDLFVSLVHDNTKLTPVQKLHHLKACLIGDAETLLRHTPITSEAYQPAWDKLKARYENKRVLVNHQLRALTGQGKVNVESVNGLKGILDTTEECLQQLHSLNINTASWDVLLIYLIVQKLPFTTMKLWEEEQGGTQDTPTYEKFKAFMQTRLRVLESISNSIISKSPQIKPNSPGKEITKSYHILQSSKCPLCSSKHFIQKCPRYIEMDIPSRYKMLKTAGRCLNCLGFHSINKCFSKHTCIKCHKRHHTSLHETHQEKHDKPTVSQPHNVRNLSNFKDSINEFNSKQGSPQATLSIDNDTDLNTSQTFINREHHNALLATALVVAESQVGEPLVLRCLIDSGSQSSFISEEACNKLRATRSPITVAITGLSVSPTATSTHRTNLILRSRDNKSTARVEEEFLILNQLTKDLPSKPVLKRDCEHIRKLKLADPTFWKPGPIDALLGARVYAKIIRDGIVLGTNTTPTAINTMFGWILLGSTTDINNYTTCSCTATIDNDHISHQLKQFWETEEFPTRPMLTAEEQECERIYQATHQRLSNGVYQVRLPFINNQTPNLGQSRGQALKRYQSLQKQLAKNADFKLEYEKCLDEYIELGHMQAVNPPSSEEQHYYIPHHAVLKESTTTKLRVVFDASARTSNGKSLHELLMNGPVLQPKLFATLLNWRKYQFALNADIEKMYRMIAVHPAHRTFQRIIWRHPQTKELQDYQLNTVTFGTKSAPYLAIRTLQQLASDELTRWPLAAKAAQSDFYVDDLLTGAETVTEARELQQQLIEMLRSAGFNLRKWASNNLILLHHLPKDHCEYKNTLPISDTDTIKTLGIRWHPLKDHFRFTVKPWRQHTTTTKRTILSEVASLYDPLGWLAPIIVRAKILMQSLWITGCNWDNEVPDSVAEQWRIFKEELHAIESIKIPRWIHHSTKAHIQIHGFCDASMKAYAATVYIRSQVGNEPPQTHLLTSKTKVAPIKPTTIPRLELNGAVLLARLIESTISDMHLTDVSVFAWTDSRIVLQWIKEHPSRWKTYVANRVVTIQEIIRFDRWRYVPTASNPADLASRGIRASTLVDNSMWWQGPTWLSRNEKEWPKLQNIEEITQLEAKDPVIVSFLTTLENNILLRYSAYNRLVQIVATLQRFISNCRNPQNKRINHLTGTEWNYAEKTILRLVQQTSFTKEYNDLSTNIPLSQHSKLWKLAPFMDQDKLIRLGGRLDKANLPFSTKHPIILPKDHHVTKILIDKIHIETLHGGTSLVLTTIRNKYWILDPRRVITTRIHKCIPCFKQRAQVRTQLMGNLPAARVTITTPFTKVGIDYAGPIMVKTSTLRKAKLQKAYFSIFICMVTRAIHLELVSSLSSEAFIAALKRFIARRGLCTDIFSDCGTNFIGGHSILDKDLKQAIKQSIPIAAQYLATQSITWHFNPPAAPHFGGLWEAGVKSVKHHLRRTLQNCKCTFEEYATVLTQVEACLNSRPLCYVRNDADDPFILTPGHFLIGRALNAIPEPSYEDRKILPSQRWTYIQQLTQHFWNRWAKDYLHQLHNRPKWATQKPNIQVGDIIILKHENMPPASWPMGIIEEVYPGADGLVRVVQVRTQTGSLKRPITKISRLPVDEIPN